MLPHSANSNHPSSSKKSDIACTSAMSLASSQFILSNSYVEDERRRSIHSVFHYSLGKIFMAPIEEGLRQGMTILGIEDSAGAWAMDMAEMYPNNIIVTAQIDGYKFTDNVPSNLSFSKCNVDSRLPFPASTFDFVFIRNASLAVLKKSWPNLLLELKRILKPGGYLEWFELSLDYTGGPLTKHFLGNLIKSYFADIGYNVNLYQEGKHLLTAVGFGTMHQQTIFLPIGALWGDVVARALAHDFLGVLWLLKSRLMAAWGITSEEFDKQVNAIVHEWNYEKKVHTNASIVVVRKPFNGINIDDPS